MEMKLRKTRLACCLLEQNPRLVFGGEEIAPAAEAAEGIVMEKLRHEKLTLLKKKRAGKSPPLMLTA